MIVYLAGPYRGKSKNKIINWLQRQINIHRARQAAKKLWAAGHTTLCPHLNTANFDGIAPDEVFLKGAISLMRRCDCIVLLPRWWRSKGTRDEVDQMMRDGKPIYFSVDHFLLGSTHPPKGFIPKDIRWAMRDR